MAMKFFLALLIFTLTDCTNNGQQYISVQDGSSKKLEKTPDKEESFGKTEIVCDTVYKNKGYKITLTLFDTANEGEATPNTLFTFSKQIKNMYHFFQTLFLIMFRKYILQTLTMMA
jgi:hypothetical protein